MGIPNKQAARYNSLFKNSFLLVRAKDNAPVSNLFSVRISTPFI